MRREFGATAIVWLWVSLGWSFLCLYSSYLSRRANFGNVLVLFLPLSWVPPYDPLLSVVHDSVPPPSPFLPPDLAQGDWRGGKETPWLAGREGCVSR